MALAPILLWSLEGLSETMPIAGAATGGLPGFPVRPHRMSQGKLPGSAGILACGVSGNDHRMTEASRQGCLRSQVVCPTIFRRSNHISYVICRMPYEIWRMAYDPNYVGR